MKLVKRLLFEDTSGHFAMMTAIMAPVALALAAVAVDAGALYTQKRDAQALADLAAIAAASRLDSPADTALDTLRSNGVSQVALGHLHDDGTLDFSIASADDQIVVTAGRYEPDSTLLPGGRFAAGNPVNGVRVVYRTKGTRYFAASLIESPDIVVAGTAAIDSRAAFSVGSRLAALNGGVINSLLGGLTGSSISLSVMDYNALLAANVSLFDVLDALALHLGLTGATYDELLDAQVTMGQIAGALNKASGLTGAAKQALSDLRTQASGADAERVQVSRLIDLGELGSRNIGASSDGMSLDVGVMDLITASAVAAGKGRQLALDLGANVPGLLRATVAVAIGEPPQSSPWLSYSERNGIVRTAQARVKVEVDIAGPGGPLGASINLPLYLELAFAEARLADVQCANGRADKARVTVEARPGVADLYLAEVDSSKLNNFASSLPKTPASLVNLPLVKVNGTAHAEIANTHFSSLTFKPNEIGNGIIKQVSTTTPLTSLTSSLLSDLSLNVQVAGIGLGLPSNIGGTVGGAVTAAAPALDALLADLLSTLGVAVGQADVQVHGVFCGRPVLVQ